MTLSQKSLSFALWNKVVSNVKTTIQKGPSLALPLFRGVVTPVQDETELYIDTLKERKAHHNNPRYVREYSDVPRLGHELYLQDPLGRDPIITNSSKR